MNQNGTDRILSAPNRFVQSYGIEHPFVSAGMGFVAMPRLVAAVSNAGGLGLLGVGPAPAPVVQGWIEEVRSLTDRPFGVDLIIDETAFGPATTEEHIDACVEQRVPVVVFFWNMPPAEWVSRLRQADCRVWMTVRSVQHAREALSAGLDAVIVQGREAGGHNKSTGGLLTLLPSVVDIAGETPIIAAGGIADGRGVAAALSLGASAVCVGTRLLASEEAFAHPEYKRRVVLATADDVVRTTIFGPEWPDQPMVVLRNQAIDESETMHVAADGGPEVIGTTMLLGRPYTMPRHSAILPTPETEGDLDRMCLAAGESAGLIHAVEPAASIVHRMMREAREAAGVAARSCFAPEPMNL